MPTTIFRTLAFSITLGGIVMLGFIFSNWQQGTLAARYFPEITHLADQPFQALLLAMPVPLHVIFIGLIIQKKHFTNPWQRFAWVGITGSGIWLGISLAIRTFWL